MEGRRRGEGGKGRHASERGQDKATAYRSIPLTVLSIPADEASHSCRP